MNKLLERIEELAEYVDFEMRAEFADRVDDLRQALATGGEPVGYMHKDSGLFLNYEKKAIFRQSWGNYTIPLYAHSQAPKRLSDDYLEELFSNHADHKLYDHEGSEISSCMDWNGFLEAIKAIQGGVDGE